MWKHHCIPQRANVLRLVTAMRLAFSPFILNHSLSMMHRLLRPEDRHLIDCAHKEDADEEMLYIQAGIYFKGTRTRLKASGIQICCTRSGRPFIQHESGDLLAPEDLEVIQEMERIIVDVIFYHRCSSCVGMMTSRGLNWRPD